MHCFVCIVEGLGRRLSREMDDDKQGRWMDDSSLLGDERDHCMT